MGNTVNASGFLGEFSSILLLNVIFGHGPKVLLKWWTVKGNT